MPITITITDPQDHAPYELRVLAEYFQALANDKRVAKTANAGPAEPMYSLSALKAAQETSAVAAEYKRTVHDEELLSEEERAALHDNIAGTSAALRASAGGDQEPYAVNAGGSDDFAELRDDPKSDASTPAAASDGKTAQAASTPSLDSAGMPWDERIHSGSKSVNADGTWRYKRGGDLAERDRVEKELLGKLIDRDSAPAALAGIEDAKATCEEHFAPNVDADDIPPPPVEDDVPPPPAEEDDVPPPPVEEEAPQVDSGAVFRAITAGQKANLSQEDIARCLKDVGLATTVDILTAKPEVLAPLKALIEEASK